MGYAVGLFGGVALVLRLSPNTHDKSVEAVMTGFFATGPLMALVGVVAVLIHRLSRPRP